LFEGKGKLSMGWFVTMLAVHHSESLSFQLYFGFAHILLIVFAFRINTAIKVKVVLGSAFNATEELLSIFTDLYLNLYQKSASLNH
jgi:hypothetical protein